MHARPAPTTMTLSGMTGDGGLRVQCGGEGIVEKAGQKRGAWVFVRVLVTAWMHAPLGLKLL